MEMRSAATSFFFQLSFYRIFICSLFYLIGIDLAFFICYFDFYSNILDFSTVHLMNMNKVQEAVESPGLKL